MSELEITISNMTAVIKLKNENDRDFYLSVAKELNLEYNNLCIELGQNIDKTIILFFLLLRTEFKKNEGQAPMVVILNLLKKIGRFIFEKNTVRQNTAEEMENIKKTRNFLISLNLSERAKLIKNGDRIEIDNNPINKEIVDLINNFSNDIKDNINILKNELLLL